MKYNFFMFLIVLVLLVGNSTTAFADDPTPGKESEGEDSTFPEKTDNNFQVLDVGVPIDIIPKLSPVFANGNFESGATIWEQSSSNSFPLIGIPNFLTPHSGIWLAWLGGANNEVSEIRQTNLQIVNPTYLNLWYRSNSQDICGYDYGYLNIQSSRLYTWDLCSSTNTSGWTELNLDLSSFNGQTVQLSIGAVTDEYLYSDLFIDDVSFYTTFADVPNGSFADNFIESIYDAGITGGCATSPLKYCPSGTVTRAQMAVFLLKGIYGSSYTPPAPTGTVFGDVPTNGFAAAFIEAFSTAGITGGCTVSPANYCPDGLVTRAQMAVFLLKAKYGSSYTPPAASGTMFTDVPSDAFAAAWIEQLATEGITSGCGSGNYCPNNSVTRAQMAVFIQKTFNLTLP